MSSSISEGRSFLRIGDEVYLGGVAADAIACGFKVVPHQLRDVDIVFQQKNLLLRAVAIACLARD